MSSRSTPFERVATPSSTGHDQPLAQFLGQIVEHLVARRLDVLEQLLHQLVVVIGQRLQHGEARFLLALEVFALELDHFGRRVLLVDMGALEREIDEAGDDVAVPDRNLPQQQRHARGRLQQLERLAHALVGLVDLVEEQKARNVLVFQFAQDQLQLRHLLLVGLADHHRGVDRRQHGAHVVDEFDRAGTIDEGVAVAHESGGGDGSFHAHLVMAGFLAGVADGGAGVDRALARDRAGAREDRLEQCGLAALEWAHQCDAPGTHVFYRIGSRAHEYLPCRPGGRTGFPALYGSIVSGEGGTGKGGNPQSLLETEVHNRLRVDVFIDQPLRLVPLDLARDVGFIDARVRVHVISIGLDETDAGRRGRDKRKPRSSRAACDDTESETRLP